MDWIQHPQWVYVIQWLESEPAVCIKGKGICWSAQQLQYTSSTDQFYSLIRACTVLQDEQTQRHNTECLLDTGKDGFLEVYVSAVEHPGRFWVQVS